MGIAVAAALLAAHPRLTDGAAASPRVGTLQGAVTRAGLPAPYTHVAVAGLNLSMTADSLGRFMLRGVPTGARELVLTRFGDSPARVPVLVHAGLSPFQWYSLGSGPDPASAMAHEAAARDSASGTIEGSITEPSGIPCPFANIIVLGTRRGAQSGQDGRFTITGVPAGRWPIKAQLAGRGPTTDTVDVAAGKVAHVMLHPGPALGLAPETLESNRAPNPWADTTYTGYPTFPGTYVLPRLGEDCSGIADTIDASPLPQRLVLDGRAGRYELAVIPGTSRVLRIRYMLRPGQRIRSLRILDDQGVVAIDFHPGGDAGPSGVATWDRVYERQTLAPPGCYRLVSETGAGIDEIPFALRWSRVRLDSIPDHAVVDGVVVDSSGRAFVGATVEGELREIQAITDANGRFELPCVPPGPHLLRAWSKEPLTLLGEIRITVQPRSHADVRIVVSVAATRPG